VSIQQNIQRQIADMNDKKRCEQQRYNVVVLQIWTIQKLRHVFVNKLDKNVVAFNQTVCAIFRV